MGNIQIKRGTKSALTTNNPTLLAGQPCFETDTGQMKVGNGTNKWNDLPYVGGGNTKSGSSIFYGKSTTAGSTAAKTVTIPDFELEIGIMVIIEFSNTNSSSTNPTLNINNTGAKTISYTGISYKNLLNNSLYLMRYDGTSYDIIGGVTGEIRNRDYFAGITSNGVFDINTINYYDTSGTAALNITNGNGSYRVDVTDLFITGGVSSNNQPDTNKMVNLHIGSLSLGNALLTYDSSSKAIKISFV